MKKLFFSIFPQHDIAVIPRAGGTRGRNESAYGFAYTFLIPGIERNNRHTYEVKIATKVVY